MITFAVVGHNEAETLGPVLVEALAARGDGDRVVFVDSASTDASALIAAGLHVDVIPAPLGKGAAMREAMVRIDTPWTVFLDGDLGDSEHAIPERLAACVRSHPDACLVAGDFHAPVRGVLSNTWGIYEPLVAALFPEAADRMGSKPLTGFRGVARDLVADVAAVPDDFGVEAHLNVLAALDGRPVRRCELGWYVGPFRYKPFMGVEIGRAVLDLAAREARIAAADRPAWDGWVLGVAEVVATFRGDVSDEERYLAELARARSRPMPPRADGSLPAVATTAELRPDAPDSDRS